MREVAGSNLDRADQHSGSINNNRRLTDQVSIVDPTLAALIVCGPLQFIVTL